MIDFHCHILPGLDDGSESWDESTEMARIAELDGITEIVCTPHVKEGYAVSSPELIAERTLEFQSHLDEAGVKIRVHAGGEVALERSLPAQIREGKVRTLGGKTRYLLLEFPWTGIPPYTETVIFEMLVDGVVPVIAHAERYREIVADPDMARGFVEKGALVQTNAGSLTGFYGDEIRRTAELLLTHNLVHIIGSDAHSAGTRRPQMAQARELIAGILGAEAADRLTLLNAASVLAGDAVLRDDPVPVASKTRGKVRSYLNRILRRA